ncbi:hypothetical protein ACFPRL_10480 [Pseudoclavibacter helvolus]
MARGAQGRTYRPSKSLSTAIPVCAPLPAATISICGPGPVSSPVA